MSESSKLPAAILASNPTREFNARPLAMTRFVCLSLCRSTSRKIVSSGPPDK
jgi:hypothetical protein